MKNGAIIPRKKSYSKTVEFSRYNLPSNGTAQTEKIKSYPETINKLKWDL